jgi:acetyl-CoA C-acetyltransferase/acetyl-CoA acyltransferase
MQAIAVAACHVMHEGAKVAVAGIAPLPTSMLIADKGTGAVTKKPVTLTRGEGIRPDTTPEALAALRPVREGGTVTAGNASRLSDGACAATG